MITDDDEDDYLQVPTENDPFGLETNNDVFDWSLAATPMMMTVSPPDNQQPEPKLVSDVVEVQLSHKPRGANNQWVPINADDAIRVTKGRGKWVRVVVRSSLIRGTPRDAQSQSPQPFVSMSPTKVVYDNIVVEVFLKDLSRGPDSEQPAEDDLKVFTAKKKLAGSVWEVEMETLIGRLSKKLQFGVTVTDLVNNVYTVGFSKPFVTHNSGTVTRTTPPPPPTKPPSSTDKKRRLMEDEISIGIQNPLFPVSNSPMPPVTFVPVAPRPQNVTSPPQINVKRVSPTANSPHHIFPSPGNTPVTSPSNPPGSPTTTSSPPVTPPPPQTQFINGSLDVNGIVRAAAFVQYSDMRLKTNFEELADAVALVNQLNGKYFEWKQNEVFQPNSGKRVIGLIAQEVQKVLPEVVRVDSNGILSVAYAEIIPVLIEAFKQHMVETKQGKSEVQAQLDEIKQKLASHDHNAHDDQIQESIRRLSIMVSDALAQPKNRDAELEMLRQQQEEHKKMLENQQAQQQYLLNQLEIQKNELSKAKEEETPKNWWGRIPTHTKRGFFTGIVVAGIILFVVGVVLVVTAPSQAPEPQPPPKSPTNAVATRNNYNVYGGATSDGGTRSSVYRNSRGTSNGNNGTGNATGNATGNGNGNGTGNGSGSGSGSGSASTTTTTTTAPTTTTTTPAATTTTTTTTTTSTTGKAQSTTAAGSTTKRITTDVVDTTVSTHVDLTTSTSSVATSSAAASSAAASSAAASSATSSTATGYGTTSDNPTTAAATTTTTTESDTTTTTTTTTTGTTENTTTTTTTTSTMGDSGNEPVNMQVVGGAAMMTFGGVCVLGGIAGLIWLYKTSPTPSKV